MSTQRGQILSHYRLDEKIGEGGMGVVWRARDTSLDRDVALKVLPEAVVADPDRLTRFEREAKTLATLSHPNIVTIHSVEEDAGTRFFTMELVKGTDLAKVIPKRGLQLDALFRIAIQIADALSAAHEQGVMHRDLKPANVMTTSDGRVKVLDFGLAKVAARVAADGSVAKTETLPITKEGTVLGTAPYMSPEQLQGLPLDARSDIFSLGVLLYEMATGKRPFGGQTTAELTSAILRDAPQLVDAVREELPHHLGRVVRRCLEKDPERRYQSAKEVRNELVALKEELTSAQLGVSSQPTDLRARSSVSSGWKSVIGVTAALLVVVVVTTVGLTWMRRVPDTSVTTQPRFESLAVLPFDNLMNDPDQDYFVDGMHEALITDLAQIGSLRVISRTSVMRYRESGKSIPEIATELGVDALVEGSVLRADGQVRITAQLIDGRTDEHLWAQDYDREVENILVMLSEVAQAIATEIEITLTPRQADLLASAEPVNPDAHEALLKGDHHFTRGNFQGFREGLPFYQQAVEIDPSYAQAWSNLALAYYALGFFSLAPPEEMAPQARSAAQRALMLDEHQGRAHGVLGSLALYFDWDWESAARELRQALELNPTDVLVHHAYADYLGVMGDIEGSLRQVKLGRQYAPMGLWANVFVLGHLAYSGHFEEVLVEGPRMELLFPDNSTIRQHQGMVLWQLGRYEDAVEKYSQAAGPDHPFVETLRQGVAEGKPKAAMRHWADQLVEQSAARPVSPFTIARYYAEAEELDLAFEWLERAFEQRIPHLLHITIYTVFDPLRSDPRYADLLRRIGFPEPE